jgi:hypothetical protein
LRLVSKNDSLIAVELGGHFDCCCCVCATALIC